MTTLTPSQQAKHDEVMNKIGTLALAVVSGNEAYVAKQTDIVSAAIAQLCAKPDSAEQVPVFYVDGVTLKGYIADPYSRESAIGVRLGDYVHQSDVPLYAAPLNIAQQAPEHDMADDDYCSYRAYQTLQTQVAQLQEENARLKECTISKKEILANAIIRAYKEFSEE